MSTPYTEGDNGKARTELRAGLTIRRKSMTEILKLVVTVGIAGLGALVGGFVGWDYGGALWAFIGVIFGAVMGAVVGAVLALIASRPR